MDDDRIQQLREEVLARLREGGGADRPGLEARVAALERTVAALLREHRPEAAPAAPHVHPHPSLQVLALPAAGASCVMEPDRPCVQSHACRVLGH